jgi:hypothetical protein
VQRATDLAVRIILGAALVYALIWLALALGGLIDTSRIESGVG